MNSDEQRWEDAENAFKKRRHKAELLLDNERYTAIDWKRPDGSIEYYVNYIVDKKRGSLIISGDLGDAIATWYSNNSAEELASYLRDIDYFISKFQCASDSYTCDDEALIRDVRKAVKEENCGILPLHEINPLTNEAFEEEWSNFKYLVPDSIHDNFFYPNDEQIEFLDRYCDEDWRESASDWGREPSQRVYLWAAGFRMAVDQLKKEGKI